MQDCPFWVFYLSKWFDKKQVKYIKNSVSSAALSWLQRSLVGIFLGEEDTTLARAGRELVLVIECLMECAGKWQFGAGFFCNSSNICAKQNLSKWETPKN